MDIWYWIPPLFKTGVLCAFLTIPFIGISCSANLSDKADKIISIIVTALFSPLIASIIASLFYILCWIVVAIIRIWIVIKN